MTLKRTWILVADAGRARVLEQLGRHTDLSLVEGFDLSHPIAKTSEIVRGGLPRTFDSVGQGRHAIEPRSDPRRLEKKEFAKDLAAKLHAACEKGAFDKLILIVPAQMMGDLRRALADDVKCRVEHEFVLDLASAPVAEIARRLKDARAA
ncbi:host attachment protein [Hyphomicrobium sp.]|uniref:host attachment protein n=1 Tax=Hyphomicrobium sp. TaxID=82 RepID=UPI0039C881E0